MTAKTIQEKIDHTADMELHTELCEAFSALRNATTVEPFLRVEVVSSGQIVKFKAADLLDQLQRAIFERQKDHRRQLATEAFLKKIDGLETGLNVLADDVGTLKGKP